MISVEGNQRTVDYILFKLQCLNHFEAFDIENTTCTLLLVHCTCSTGIMVPDIERSTHVLGVFYTLMEVKVPSQARVSRVILFIIGLW